MNLPVVYTAAIGAAFLCSVVLTAIVKKLAVKADFVSRPRADRFNRSVIPLGGGIAIFVTIALFCLAAVFGAKLGKLPFYSTEFMGRCNELLVLLGCATVLFGLGLWDDLKNLGPKLKLVVQFGTAFCAAYFADARVELFIPSKIITSIISSIWIVLIINVFNFLDNMDGASAGIALIATIILFFAAAMSGQVFVAGLAIVLAGALAGFLMFNFFPASIFMGDSGSLVIGFFVAVLTMRTTYYQTGSGDKWYVVLMPIMIMALPLYDFITVTALRIKQGKSPFVGDTQHFSHRLKKRGLSEVQTVLTLYMATLATGVGAIVLKIINSPFSVLVFLQVVLVLVIIGILESTDNNGESKQQ